MGYKKYIVRLKDEEKAKLKEITTRGSGLIRRVKHAMILLNVDEGNNERLTDKKISHTLGVGITTVGRIRRRYVEKGLDFALNGEHVNRDYRSKVNGDLEAHLIMLACTEPPEGRAKWTVRLLADKVVELGYIDSISKTTIALALKKMNLSHGR